LTELSWEDWLPESAMLAVVTALKVPKHGIQGNSTFEADHLVQHK
jgi:hypothetical protein